MSHGLVNSSIKLYVVQGVISLEFLSLFPKLCSNLINSPVLSLRNSNKHVDDEEDLDDHEDQEHVGATQHLIKEI